MKRINRFLVILFIISIFLSLILAGWFLNDTILQTGEEIAVHSLLINYVSALFISILYLNGLISPLYIFIIYLNIRKWKNNKRINNKEIIYERDLPSYNAAVGAYLLDGVIDVDRDYNAVVTELISKKIIKKNKNKYEIPAIKNCLLVHSKTEKYVLSNLNGKINKREFKKAVLEDCQNLGLITKANIPVVGLLLVLLFFNQIYLVILGFIYFKTSLLQELVYKLTSKGGREKDKMLKLKAFLHDFSNIEDVEKIEHNIWDRYLSFAIALDENDNFKEVK